MTHEVVELSCVTRHGSATERFVHAGAERLHNIRPSLTVQCRLSAGFGNPPPYFHDAWVLDVGPRGETNHRPAERMNPRPSENMHERQ
jgi:hypothetical protein